MRDWVNPWIGKIPWRREDLDLVATIYWPQILCLTSILFSLDQVTFQSRFYDPIVMMKEVRLRELKLRH